MLTFHVDSLSLDFTIPGPHEEVQVVSPSVPKKQTHFWGVVGTSVIVSQRAARMLTVGMWLNDPSWLSSGDLYGHLEQMDSTLVGQIGALRVHDDTNGYWPANQDQTFYDVLFDSYLPLPLAGQPSPSPVRDLAGSLYRSGAQAGAKSWLLRMQLNFLQALPGRVVM
jgi:hypothetical protein